LGVDGRDDAKHQRAPGGGELPALTAAVGLIGAAFDERMPAKPFDDAADLSGGHGQSTRQLSLIDRFGCVWGRLINGSEQEPQHAKLGFADSRALDPAGKFAKGELAGDGLTARQIDAPASIGRPPRQF
jgi:hypothetical protein